MKQRIDISRCLGDVSGKAELILYRNPPHMHSLQGLYDDGLPLQLLTGRRECNWRGTLLVEGHLRNVASVAQLAVTEMAHLRRCCSRSLTEDFAF